MDAGVVRILSAAILGLGLLIQLSVGPAAAATCALSAPATAKVGTPLAIIGSGFPASASIDVSIELDGAMPDQFAVQSDPAGAFQISLTPEPADVGKTTLKATAGSTCSAQAVFNVIEANATATPKPAATTPASGSGAGGRANAPRTDAVSGSLHHSGDRPWSGWPMATLMIVLGACGLIATRRNASR